MASTTDPTDKTEHRAAREPTSEEWRVRDTFLSQGRSVSMAAYALGIERGTVIRAVDRCRWWLSDSGWTAEFALAKRLGFGDSDAHMRADIVANYNTRNHGA